MSQPAPISRTQNWLTALLFTAVLVCIGVIATLLTQKNAVSPEPTVATATITSAAIIPAIATPQTAGNIIPVSQNTTTPLSEPSIRQTAQKILPTQSVLSVKKVNYEGKLAYEIVTAENQLYLNAYTGEVIAMTPVLKPDTQLMQVNYQAENRREHDDEKRHHEDDENEEHDDD